MPEKSSDTVPKDLFEKLKESSIKVTAQINEKLSWYREEYNRLEKKIARRDNEIARLEYENEYGEEGEEEQEDEVGDCRENQSSTERETTDKTRWSQDVRETLDGSNKTYERAKAGIVADSTASNTMGKGSLPGTAVTKETTVKAEGESSASAKAEATTNANADSPPSPLEKVAHDRPSNIFEKQPKPVTLPS